ncbi:type VI secretion system contractile sheath large subunit [Paracraurococcus lichenis]|uniref:Type VI secretion system contractile sheath large subunit n=1 Tax=Paracraurococcus lichenis TaxID=3064888 RepID=A0ABT9EAE3_9PROT|nr:type VI secretion system contractile sheath large subunit [Paracraurococcus sp. LOR1-02]MDO9712943.1 type VI secretion system contractile sheath large subunit [Paracraurococcus sp. LOR1-02]
MADALLLSSPAPATATPLRDAVLAGRFFGSDRAAEAARLAGVLAPRPHRAAAGARPGPAGPEAPHDPGEPMRRALDRAEAACQAWSDPEAAACLAAEPAAVRAALEQAVAALGRAVAAIAAAVAGLADRIGPERAAEIAAAAGVLRGELDRAGSLVERLLAAMARRRALDAWLGPERAARLAAEPRALRGALDRDIAALDRLIGRQLDAVLHHPRLRQMEGRWRGLCWLLHGIEQGRRVKLRLLPITWAELCRDFERAAEFDASTLFRLIYEEEFGKPGGEPYGLLVVDHAVRHRPAPEAPADDVAALASLASVGAAAFAPVVAAAHPALLEAADWQALEMVRDIAAPLRDADHARWRGLAGRADLRFLAVALPDLLARPPWRADPARSDGFRYEESAPGAAQRVWMPPGYAFAACAARAFARHGWPADVRGAETDRVGGGLVAGLPHEDWPSAPAGAWDRPSVALLLTDEQERALLEHGLMPVCALPYARELVFGAVRSLQAPARHGGPAAAAADANARLSVQVNAMLCASRFAHVLKVMGREMTGAFATAEEIEARLQSWLQGYVNANMNAAGDLRARFPLTEGRVQVRERPGRPGAFGCIIHLKPHYQLDDVAASFTLQTEFTGPGRGSEEGRR